MSASPSGGQSGTDAPTVRGGALPANSTCKLLSAGIDKPDTGFGINVRRSPI